MTPDRQRSSNDDARLSRWAAATGIAVIAAVFTSLWWKTHQPHETPPAAVATVPAPAASPGAPATPRAAKLKVVKP